MKQKYFLSAIFIIVTLLTINLRAQPISKINFQNMPATNNRAANFEKRSIENRTYIEQPSGIFIAQKRHQANQNNFIFPKGEKELNIFLQQRRHMAEIQIEMKPEKVKPGEIVKNIFLEQKRNSF